MTAQHRRVERDGVPRLVVVLAGLAVSGLLLPVLALAWEAPWSRVAEIVTDDGATEAFRLSIVVSLLATAASLVLGLPLAWVLARTRFPGRRFVRALAVLPLVLPPVVGGVALLSAFGRRGLVGSWLADLGIELAFSTAGTVVAATFVAMPFMIVTMEAAFVASDRRLEEAVRTLGAGPWRVFTSVTLPAVAPSLAAGAVLSWARALGEFGATLAFAGSFPGTTRTLPLEVYLRLETDPAAAVVLSLVLVLVALVVLVALRDRWLGSR